MSHVRFVFSLILDQRKCFICTDENSSFKLTLNSCSSILFVAVYRSLSSSVPYRREWAQKSDTFCTIDVLQRLKCFVVRALFPMTLSSLLMGERDQSIAHFGNKIKCNFCILRIWGGEGERGRKRERAQQFTRVQNGVCACVSWSQ